MRAARRALSLRAPAPVEAVVAVGSNVGDRVGAVRDAVRLLSRERGVEVSRTAQLYTSRPMYVEAQPEFLNTAALVTTTLPPLALLDALHRVEAAVGRDRGPAAAARNGPRRIDLDLVLYADRDVREPRLTVPHPRAAERLFVLEPLADLGLDGALGERARSLGYWRHLRRLRREADPAGGDCARVWPAGGRGEGCALLRLGGPRTHVMAVMNATPDSFSDGGRLGGGAEAVRARAAELVAAGADVLDVGGESTRPGAPEVCELEEAARVVPAVEAVRSHPDPAVARVPLSVDTRRAAVARAAVAAGATAVNDVSGGAHDPDMRAAVAAMGVPLVAMHSRGTPRTMQLPEHTDYARDGGVAAGVRAGLEELFARAAAAGVPAWDVALDPGVGFAKTPAQSAELLRDLRACVPAGGPASRAALLVGPSRKGFIGELVGRRRGGEPPAPADPLRAWGTAAAVCAAVAGGADVVRVHDAAEMAAVLAVADALLKPRPRRF